MVNLAYFAEVHHDECMKVYQESISPKHQYFFASAGLYITLEIWRYLNEDRLTEVFCSAKSSDHALRLFNEVYCVIFTDFSEH